MIHLHTGGSCPVVSGQGCVILTVLVPRWAGSPVCGSYAQFFVLLCDFEQNPAVLCAYVIYRYRIINWLYYNTISNYLYCIIL